MGNTVLPMSVSPSTPLTTLFRSAPARTALLSIVPVTLALAQLANSYLNGLSTAYAAGFAVAMVVFAAVATGHFAAQHRIDALESGLDV